jgi:hypothetical protein
VEDMLAGERALIVFDELSDYIMNFIGGEYRDYARSVINFVEYFIQAVRKSKSVAVITLPVDASGKTDFRYEDSEKLILSLWNTLKDNAELIEPLSSESLDITNVLKKRLFESIPDFVKDKTIQRLKEKVENYMTYFGTIEYVHEVEETYPFSPDYIRLLQEVIIRAGLQKTRDALAISMKVVRGIHQSNEDPDLIMPFHINLTWFDNVFVSTPDEYRHIYVRQVESYESSRYGNLPKYILRVIFLATYHYDSAVPLEQFPTKNDIVRMVYEPATFSVSNLEVPDVENAINEILSSTEITHLNEKDGKFWFWRFPNIKEYIRKRAERILRDEDPEIYTRMEEFVKLGLKGNLEKFAQAKVSTTKGKKGKVKLPEHVFEEFYIIKDYDVYPDDDQKLKLVVLLRPDLVSEIETLMWNVEKSPRTYRNTLVFLTPVDSGDYLTRDRWPKEYKDLMRSIAGLIASERILEEIYTIYGEYGEDAVNVQKTIIDNEMARYRSEVAGMVPKAFTYVFYPINEKQIGVAKIVNTGYYLPYHVQETLMVEDKLVESLDFEYFAALLKQEMGVDLDTDEKMKTVEQVIGWFHQNPKFPMVKAKTIKDTIADGVRMLRIGIMRGKGDRAEIYFKPVHDTRPVTQDVEGRVPSQILDDDGILSRQRAIEEQFKLLKSKQVERVLPTHVERIYYVVYADTSDSYTLDQLETLPDWREIFFYGVIVRVVEKVDMDLLLEIYPANVQTVERSESATFVIQARPINLKCDGVGIVIKSKKDRKTILDKTPSPEITDAGKVYRVEFEVEPVEKVEEFEVVVTTVGEQEITKKATIKVVIRDKKEDIIVTKKIGPEHIGCKLLSISEVEDFDVLEELKSSVIPLGRNKVSGKVYGGIKVVYAGGEMDLTVRGMELEVGVDATIELAEYGDEKSFTSRYRVEFENTVLDELLVKKLERLNNRVAFTLRREE